LIDADLLNVHAIKPKKKKKQCDLTQVAKALLLTHPFAADPVAKNWPAEQVKDEKERRMTAIIEAVQIVWPSFKDLQDAQKLQELEALVQHVCLWFFVAAKGKKKITNKKKKNHLHNKAKSAKSDAAKRVRKAFAEALGAASLADIGPGGSKSEAAVQALTGPSTAAPAALRAILSGDAVLQARAQDSIAAKAFVRLVLEEVVATGEVFSSSKAATKKRELRFAALLLAVDCTTAVFIEKVSTASDDSAGSSRGDDSSSNGTTATLTRNFKVVEGKVVPVVSTHDAGEPSKKKKKQKQNDGTQ
jgi:hypothetical protein